MKNLKHPCEGTCSGWDNGYEVAIKEFKQEIITLKEELGLIKSAQRRECKLWDELKKRYKERIEELK